MSTIGTTPSPAILDRSIYIQRVADAFGQSVEEVTAQIDEQDKTKLEVAESVEQFYSGKGVNVNGTTPEMAASALAQAREARSQHYSMVPGAVTIEALNVDSAIKAQGTMTGGDLKDLSRYGDYLRSEVGAASSARSDVTFTGAWGKDQVTHDVNEYIGWLMQAAQGKSPGTAQAAGQSSD